MTAPKQGGRIAKGISMQPEDEQFIQHYANQFTGGNFSLAVIRLAKSGLEAEREKALAAASGS